MSESESSYEAPLTMDELYDLYVEYVADMSRARDGRELPLFDYPKFVGWWAELDDENRETLRDKFKRGFARVVLDSRDELKKLFPFPEADQTNG